VTPTREHAAEPVFVNLLRSPGIDSQHGGIYFKESIPPDWESIPEPLKVYKYMLWIRILA
jgi:hypothetical protein